MSCKKILYVCCAGVFLLFLVRKNIFYTQNCKKIYIGKEYFYIYDFVPKKEINKTFIILPSYSYFDASIYMNTKKYIKYEPNKDFKLLIDELVKNNNRVIVVEYFGYNNSGETSRTRDSNNICEEIHKVIEILNINKYILLAHSISGLYSLDYLTKYRNEVEGFVGMDITLPYYFLEECNSNEKYLEHKFNADGQKISESYINMHKYFWETAKKLEHFKFHNDLPAILFTSTMLIDNINEQIKDGLLRTKVIDHLNNMITNNNIQQIHILEGTHYLHHSQSKNMAEFIKNKF